MLKLVYSGFAQAGMTTVTGPATFASVHDHGCHVRFPDGERCELSEREMQLLRYLAGHAGRAISREELLRRVWRMDPSGIETRTIDMHIARLRDKMRDSSGTPRDIRTVRGKGYLFTPTGHHPGRGR